MEASAIALAGAEMRRDCQQDDASKCVLNSLKFEYNRVRCTKEGRVGIVKPRVYQSVGNNRSSLSVKIRSDVTKCFDMIETRLGNQADVFVE